MKIFNNNGNEVYVQLKDLLILYYGDEEIPESIYNKVFTDRKIYSGNLEKFIKFNTIEEISFFNRQNWIISWNYYSECSKEDVIRDIERNKIISTSLQNRYLNNPPTEDEERKNFDLELTHLMHKLCALNLILDYKSNKIDISFPLEPDFYGLRFGDKNYEMSRAIDPSKLLISRKDGKPLSKDEIIPKSFIQMGLSIDAIEKENSKFLSGEYTIDIEISPDNKYLVLTYVINKDKELEETIKEEKPVKKVLNKLFKR